MNSNSKSSSSSQSSPSLRKNNKKAISSSPHPTLQPSSTLSKSKSSSRNALSPSFTIPTTLDLHHITLFSRLTPRSPSLITISKRAQSAFFFDDEGDDIISPHTIPPKQTFNQPTETISRHSKPNTISTADFQALISNRTPTEDNDNPFDSDGKKTSKVQANRSNYNDTKTTYQAEAQIETLSTDPIDVKKTYQAQVVHTHHKAWTDFSNQGLYSAAEIKKKSTQKSPKEYDHDFSQLDKSDTLSKYRQYRHQHRLDTQNFVETVDLQQKMEEHDQFKAQFIGPNDPVIQDMQYTNNMFRNPDGTINLTLLSSGLQNISSPSPSAKIPTPPITNVTPPTTHTPLYKNSKALANMPISLIWSLKDKKLYSSQTQYKELKDAQRDLDSLAIPEAELLRTTRRLLISPLERYQTDMEHISLHFDNHEWVEATTVLFDATSDLCLTEDHYVHFFTELRRHIEKLNNTVSWSLHHTRICNAVTRVTARLISYSLVSNNVSIDQRYNPTQINKDLLQKPLQETPSSEPSPHIDIATQFHNSSAPSSISSIIQPDPLSFEDGEEIIFKKSSEVRTDLVLPEENLKPIPAKPLVIPKVSDESLDTQKSQSDEPSTPKITLQQVLPREVIPNQDPQLSALQESLKLHPIGDVTPQIISETLQTLYALQAPLLISQFNSALVGLYCSKMTQWKNEIVPLLREQSQSLQSLSKQDYEIYCAQCDVLIEIEIFVRNTFSAVARARLISETQILTNHVTLHSIEHMLFDKATTDAIQILDQSRHSLLNQPDIIDEDSDAETDISKDLFPLYSQFELDQAQELKQIPGEKDKEKEANIRKKKDPTPKRNSRPLAHYKYVHPSTMFPEETKIDNDRLNIHHDGKKKKVYAQYLRRIHDDDDAESLKVTTFKTRPERYEHLPYSRTFIQTHTVNMADLTTHIEAFVAEHNDKDKLLPFFIFSQFFLPGWTSVPVRKLQHVYDKWSKLHTHDAKCWDKLPFNYLKLAPSAEHIQIQVLSSLQYQHVSSQTSSQSSAFRQQLDEKLIAQNEYGFETSNLGTTTKVDLEREISNLSLLHAQQAEEEAHIKQTGLAWYNQMYHNRLQTNLMVENALLLFHAKKTSVYTTNQPSAIFSSSFITPAAIHTSTNTAIHSPYPAAVPTLPTIPLSTLIINLNSHCLDARNSLDSLIQLSCNHSKHLQHTPGILPPSLSPIHTSRYVHTLCKSIIPVSYLDHYYGNEQIKQLIGQEAFASRIDHLYDVIQAVPPEFQAPHVSVQETENIGPRQNTYIGYSHWPFKHRTGRIKGSHGVVEQDPNFDDKLIGFARASESTRHSSQYFPQSPYIEPRIGQRPRHLSLENFLDACIYDSPEDKARKLFIKHRNKALLLGILTSLCALLDTEQEYATALSNKKTDTNYRMGDYLDEIDTTTTYDIFDDTDTVSQENSTVGDYHINVVSEDADLSSEHVFSQITPFNVPNPFKKRTNRKPVDNDDDNENQSKNAKSSPKRIKRATGYQPLASTPLLSTAILNNLVEALLRCDQPTLAYTLLDHEKKDAISGTQDWFLWLRAQLSTMIISIQDEQQLMKDEMYNNKHVHIEDLSNIPRPPFWTTDHDTETAIPIPPNRDGSIPLPDIGHHMDIIPPKGITKNLLIPYDFSPDMKADFQHGYKYTPRKQNEPTLTEFNIFALHQGLPLLGSSSLLYGRFHLIKRQLRMDDTSSTLFGMAKFSFNINKVQQREVEASSSILAFVPYGVLRAFVAPESPASSKPVSSFVSTPNDKNNDKLSNLDPKLALLKDTPRNLHKKRRKSTRPIFLRPNIATYEMLLSYASSSQDITLTTQIHSLFFSSKVLQQLYSSTTFHNFAQYGGSGAMHYQSKARSHAQSAEFVLTPLRLSNFSANAMLALLRIPLSSHYSFHLPDNISGLNLGDDPEKKPPSLSPHEFYEMVQQKALEDLKKKPNSNYDSVHQESSISSILSLSTMIPQLGELNTTNTEYQSPLTRPRTHKSQLNFEKLFVRPIFYDGVSSLDHTLSTSLPTTHNHQISSLTDHISLMWQAYNILTISAPFQQSNLVTPNLQLAIASLCASVGDIQGLVRVFKHIESSKSMTFCASWLPHLLVQAYTQYLHQRRVNNEFEEYKTATASESNSIYSNLVHRNVKFTSIHHEYFAMIETYQKNVHFLQTQLYDQISMLQRCDLDPNWQLACVTDYYYLDHYDSISDKKVNIANLNNKFTSQQYMDEHRVTIPKPNKNGTKTRLNIFSDTDKSISTHITNFHSLSTSVPSEEPIVSPDNVLTHAESLHQYLNSLTSSQHSTLPVLSSKIAQITNNTNDASISKILNADDFTVFKRNVKMLQKRFAVDNFSWQQLAFELVKNHGGQLKSALVHLVSSNSGQTLKRKSKPHGDIDPNSLNSPPQPLPTKFHELGTQPVATQTPIMSDEQLAKFKSPDGNKLGDGYGFIVPGDEYDFYGAPTTMSPSPINELGSRIGTDYNTLKNQRNQKDVKEQQNENSSTLTQTPEKNGIQNADFEPSAGNLHNPRNPHHDNFTHANANGQQNPEPNFSNEISQRIRNHAQTVVLPALFQAVFNPRIPVASSGLFSDVIPNKTSLVWFTTRFETRLSLRKTLSSILSRKKSLYPLIHSFTSQFYQYGLAPFLSMGQMRGSSFEHPIEQLSLVHQPWTKALTIPELINTCLTDVLHLYQVSLQHFSAHYKGKAKPVNTLSSLVHLKPPGFQHELLTKLVWLSAPSLHYHEKLNRAFSPAQFSSMTGPIPQPQNTQLSPLSPRPASPALTEAILERYYHDTITKSPSPLASQKKITPSSRNNLNESLRKNGISIFGSDESTTLDTSQLNFFHIRNKRHGLPSYPAFEARGGGSYDLSSLLSSKLLHAESSGYFSTMIPAANTPNFNPFPVMGGIRKLIYDEREESLRLYLRFGDALPPFQPEIFMVESYNLCRSPNSTHIYRPLSPHLFSYDDDAPRRLHRTITQPEALTPTYKKFIARRHPGFGIPPESPFLTQALQQIEENTTGPIFPEQNLISTFHLEDTEAEDDSPKPTSSSDHFPENKGKTQQRIVGHFRKALCVNPSLLQSELETLSLNIRAGKDIDVSLIINTASIYAFMGDFYSMAQVLHRLYLNSDDLLVPNLVPSRAQLLPPQLTPFAERIGQNDRGGGWRGGQSKRAYNFATKRFTDLPAYHSGFDVRALPQPDTPRINPRLLPQYQLAVHYSRFPAKTKDFISLFQKIAMHSHFYGFLSTLQGFSDDIPDAKDEHNQNSIPNLNSSVFQHSRNHYSTKHRFPLVPPEKARSDDTLIDLLPYQQAQLDIVEQLSCRLFKEVELYLNKHLELSYNLNVSRYQEFLQFLQYKQKKQTDPALAKYYSDFIPRVTTMPIRQEVNLESTYVDFIHSLRQFGPFMVQKYAELDIKQEEQIGSQNPQPSHEIFTSMLKNEDNPLTKSIAQLEDSHSTYSRYTIKQCDQLKDITFDLCHFTSDYLCNLFSHHNLQEPTLPRLSDELEHVTLHYSNNNNGNSPSTISALVLTRFFILRQSLSLPHFATAFGTEEQSLKNPSNLNFFPKPLQTLPAIYSELRQHDQLSAFGYATSQLTGISDDKFLPDLIIEGNRVAMLKRNLIASLERGHAEQDDILVLERFTQHLASQLPGGFQEPGTYIPIQPSFHSPSHAFPNIAGKNGDNQHSSSFSNDHSESNDRPQPNRSQFNYTNNSFNSGPDNHF